MHEESIKIRELNDRFRQGDPIVRGHGVYTIGIHEMVANNPSAKAELIKLIRQYDAFNQGNDPWGEHDFGSFQFRGEQCFWKIDVYDSSLECAALDPSDPKHSCRVLTIMLASEY